MQTPWGKSQEQIKLERGVTWVSTAGHGGIMVSRGAAEKLLSEQARNHAERYGDYFAFEEDCKYQIVLFEHPEYAEKLGIKSLANNYDTLSQWDPQYLIDRGLEPHPEPYKRWLEWQESDRLRAEKSPELIVTAWGDWADWVPKGMVGIQTADDKRYLVPNAAYPAKGYRLSAYPEKQDVPLSPSEYVLHKELEQIFERVSQKEVA